MYSSLVHQLIPSILKSSSAVGYIVLIVSAYLIQILFGSLLHTERTSVTSFIRIDTFDDVNKYNMTKYLLDISTCPKLIKKEENFQMVRIAEQSVVGASNYRWCWASGKCAMLANNLDFSLLISMACTFFPKSMLENPHYLSPPLGRTLNGYFLGRKIPKDERNHIDSLILRSFEMGLEFKKGATSQNLGVKTIKTMTRMNKNEECYSKKIQTSISSPVPLNIRFFRNCYILHSVIIFFALNIHLGHLWIQSKSYRKKQPSAVIMRVGY